VDVVPGLFDVDDDYGKPVNRIREIQ
jgi:hypothetical protein